MSREADMATAEQMKALIKAHFDDDYEKFKTVALQVAAYEARAGHTSYARDIKNLVQPESVTSWEHRFIRNQSNLR